MIKVFLVTAFLFAGITKTQAQQNDQSQGDSLERVLLKDSLSISDSTITQIFSARDYYSSQATTIRSDSTLSNGQKGSLLQALRIQTNNTIKSLLGTTNYNLYRDMIARRMQQRGEPPGAQPLAGSDN